MTPRMVRRAVALAVAAACLLPGPASAAGSRAVQAVDWNVNHATRTITATVRLRIASACTRGQMARATTQGPAAARRCKVGPEIAAAIRDNVDAVWNAGHRYFCYTLKVETDIQVADELIGAIAGSEATPNDRAFVAIDQSPVGIRSFVASHGFEGATWDGYAPTDAILPANGGAEPSTWQYPQTWERSLYAHEVGHVLGLSDHYEDVRVGGDLSSRPRPGAPVDVMSDVTTTAVDPSTVNRLVARAGVSPYTLECDWTVDQAVPGGRMTGTKCGGIEGDWVIRTDIAQGPTTLQQTWSFTADAAGSGGFRYEDHSLTTVPQSTAEGWGTSSGYGTVAIQWDGSVTMRLAELRHRTRGKGTAGGRTIAVPESDAPLVDWDFRWQPARCPAPG